MAVVFETFGSSLLERINTIMQFVYTVYTQIRVYIREKLQNLINSDYTESF